MTFGTGSGVPNCGCVPAMTLPVMLVSPTGHVVWSGQRLVHVCVELTHWLLTLGPPHVWPAGHVPHCRTLPQPSPCTPQAAPSDWHVLGTHICASPPPAPV